MKSLWPLIWVLCLSYLTHLGASPDWRAPEVIQTFVSANEWYDNSQWNTEPEGARLAEGPDRSVYLVGPSNRWLHAKRSFALTEADRLIRLQATLRSITPPLQRVTPFPRPVLHVHIEQATEPYPLVEHPMFFQSKVVLDKIVELDSSATSMELALIASPGSHWRLSDVIVTSVVANDRYQIGLWVLALLWLLTLLAGVYFAWQRAKLPTVVVGVVFSTVLVGVLSSRTQVIESFGVISRGMQTIGTDLNTGHLTLFMQIGHVSLFTALTFSALLFHTHWRFTFKQVLLWLVALAIATEALQRHVIGRNPDIQDFMFDIVGIGLGVVFYFVVQRFVPR